MNSSIFCKRTLLAILYPVLLFICMPVIAAPSESQLIDDLGSPSAGKVINALEDLQKYYPTGTNAFPAMRKLLGDPRIKVQRKAARVIGILHAPVDQADIDNICTLLKSSDNATITDGLKSLRGLDAPRAVPEIVPLLKYPNSHIKRDACRTLAVLGTKDLVPQIQPLLTDPEPDVQNDARDAINALQAK